MATTPGYRELTEREALNVQDVKGMGDIFLRALAAAEPADRGGREFAVARTKVEEAVMWAVKGITA